MEQLYTELNPAQGFIYTASNIGRAYPDFDYGSIAGIYKRDNHCLVVRTDGSEELYEASLVQNAYLKFRERLTHFFHCLGYNYRGPSLWRDGYYIMFKGIHYAHATSSKSTEALAQQFFEQNYEFNRTTDRDVVIAALENDQCNIGHLIKPDGDDYSCSCGSFQKQYRNIDGLRQELNDPKFKPSCIHLVWLHTYRRFLKERAALVSSIPSGMPKKCAAWIYEPMVQGGPTPHGSLKIFYTDQGHMAPRDQWKEYFPDKTFTEEHLWTYLFKMVNAGYVPFLGSILTQFSKKNERNSSESLKIPCSRSSSKTSG